MREPPVVAGGAYACFASTTHQGVSARHLSRILGLRKQDPQRRTSWHAATLAGVLEQWRGARWVAFERSGGQEQQAQVGTRLDAAPATSVLKTVRTVAFVSRHAEPAYGQRAQITARSGETTLAAIGQEAHAFAAAQQAAVSGEEQPRQVAASQELVGTTR